MQSLLEGVTVLDLGRMYAASYCGKLMLDAGAEVIHVEHPDGDPLRALGPFAPDDARHELGAAFAFLNAGKRCASLDYRSAEGAARLWDLVERADILIENGRPGTLDRHGFTTEAILARNPRLVRVSITNYGLTGPNRDFPATEMTLQAAAGLMDCNGEFEREPLRYPMNIAQHWAGANAAHAALIAYWGALTSGEGQQVDVSIQESLAATWWMQYAEYQYTGSLLVRGQGTLLQAEDGLLMANWVTSVPWEEYALAFDAVELAVDEALKPPGILADPVRLNAILSEHTKAAPRQHWFGRCIEAEIPAGMLQPLEEVAACPQLAERHFWDRLETPWGDDVPFPAEYYLVDGKPRTETVRRRVAAVGEDNAAAFGGQRGADGPARLPSAGDTMALPLAGIRVLDNGIVQAGTFPARQLADFGAEVVRVENYHNPDIARNLVYTGGIARDPYWEAGGTYHEQHRNKTYGVGLDVRTPAGRRVFLELVTKSDIVLDSHPPGVMEKLGLGYDAIREANPRAIFMTSSGYGYGGRYSSARSYGMMTELMCGSGWLNGYEGGVPRRGYVPLTDHPATYHSAFLALAALIRRRETGEGMWLDVSQYEASVNLLGDAHVANALGAPLPTRAGNVEPGTPFSGVFPCAGDDAWVAVAVTDEASWQALCATVGRSDLTAKQPADVKDEATTAVTAWTRERTPQEAMDQLCGVGVAAGAANNHRDLLLDRHLAERGFFWLVDHAPEQHAGRRAWPGATAKMSATPAESKVHAPMVGEHNEAVATGLLGYSAAEFAAMQTEGAFGTTPRAAAMKPPQVDPAARPHVHFESRHRTKEWDPLYMEKLRARFGPEYGPAPEDE